MRYFFMAAFLTIFGLPGLPVASAEEYNPSELAGKWEGTPPLGGKLIIDIEVSPSGEIKGKGRIPTPVGTRAAAPNVEGKVAGRKVDIDYWFLRGGTTVRFVCDWVEKSVLNCITRNKKHETEFKRLD
jgi:hypothetical protein